jgi:hypothetical protein
VSAAGSLGVECASLPTARSLGLALARFGFAVGSVDIWSGVGFGVPWGWGSEVLSLCFERFAKQSLGSMVQVRWEKQGGPSMIDPWLDQF